MKKSQPGLYKNAFYINGGFIGALFFNGNYERMIWGNKNPAIRSVMIRLGLVNLQDRLLVDLFQPSKLIIQPIATLGMLIGKEVHTSNLMLGLFISMAMKPGHQSGVAK